MRLVLISDVHERWHHLTIPPCDVLISCGDYSFTGQPPVVHRFHAWLNEQPARHVISVQGNHELWVERHLTEAQALAEAACPRAHFIVEQELIIEGIKFYCSAVTPEFNCWAFGVPRGLPIERRWDSIPDGAQVLVTHGPPFGVLDEIPKFGHVGCEELAKRVKKLPSLKLHAFGHIHEGRGAVVRDSVTFINCAICDERYAPTYEPVVFDLPNL